MKRSLRVQLGFSLVELSIVLVIVGLLSSGLMLAIAAQQDIAANSQARDQLDNATDALLGFAVRHGRLPCPAAPASNGEESPVGGGNCSHPWNGFLPGITLGILPVDAQGYAIDPWGNPIRYAVSSVSHPACGAAPCLTSENGLQNAWNSESKPSPDLHVCSSAKDSSIGHSAECATGRLLTRDATVVIFSLGKNGRQPATSEDESSNQNNDRLFVAHELSAAPSEFDDQVSWISTNILYSRLLAAGRLP